MDNPPSISNEDEVRKALEVHYELKKYIESTGIKPSEHLVKIANTVCPITQEDVFFALYIEKNIFPLTTRPIDRLAADIGAEVKRHRREERQAKRNFSSVERCVTTPASKFGDPIVIENYVINYSKTDQEIKMMLGGDLCMPKEVQKKLGVSVDSSKNSLWDQRHVRWQAGAQVLWFYNPTDHTKEIQEKMLGNRELYELLGFDSLTSIINPESRGRGLEDVIREVNPEPGNRGRPLKNRNARSHCTTVIPIPKVRNRITKEINIKSMKLAIFTISQVLALKGIATTQILQHPIISTYKAMTSPLFAVLMNRWIVEALKDS